MPPLIREEETYVMDSRNVSYDDHMSTYMLECIPGGSQSHPNVNMREACYKIYDRIRQI